MNLIKKQKKIRNIKVVEEEEEDEEENFPLFLKHNSSPITS
jgi:hypothetical protein